MKYEINFDKDFAEKKFNEISRSIDWSERSYETNDVMRNIVNTTIFEREMGELRLFGAEVRTGTYEEKGFLRIGYARINSHEVVKNGQINPTALKNALWEIAHLN